jgi:predicted metal-binding membrane protein
MAEKIRKIGPFVAGIILVVLGALMLAEGIVTLMGNTAFLFVDNMNRGFELVVGLVTIIVAAATMDSS